MNISIQKISDGPLLFEGTTFKWKKAIIAVSFIYSNYYLTIEFA